MLLGTCGDMYKPIQNASGFELIDALLELTDGGAYYETAGALGNGEVVWALAKIPETMNVTGDGEHKLYLLFSTRHDGNGSAKCKLVDTRVVCVCLCGKHNRRPCWPNCAENCSAGKSNCCLSIPWPRP